jgi:hypothetical protein
VAHHLRAQQDAAAAAAAAVHTRGQISVALPDVSLDGRTLVAHHLRAQQDAAAAAAGAAVHTSGKGERLCQMSALMDARSWRTT